MTLNKAFVAGLACAVGVCAFAAVEGNNTAVVIRKTAIVSTEGWQYLTVPVRGFDITGLGKVDGVPLQDVLPASMYQEETTLMVEGNAEAGDTTYVPNGTYTLTSGSWNSGSGSIDAALLLKAAARVWLKVPVATANAANDDLFAMAGAGVASATTAADAATAPTETIFAGEQNTVKYLVSGEINGMTAFGNASSEVVEFPVQALTTPYISESSTTKLVQNPKLGDQLLRLGNNRKTYIYYSYVPQVGSTPARWVTATKFDGLGIEPNKIAPGEAFYYYRAGAAN